MQEPMEAECKTQVLFLGLRGGSSSLSQLLGAQAPRARGRTSSLVIGGPRCVEAMSASHHEALGGPSSLILSLRALLSSPLSRLPHRSGEDPGRPPHLVAHRILCPLSSPGGCGSSLRPRPAGLGVRGEGGALPHREAVHTAGPQQHFQPHSPGN